MSEGLELALKTALVGIGATLVLDVWNLLLNFAFRVTPPNFAMVGRWIGHVPRGRFVHESVASAQAIAGEHVIGWLAHYAIGVLFAGILVTFAGVDWLSRPTLLPAFIVGIVTVAAPLLVMQPAMGLGIASSRAPKPNVARLRTLAAHAVFGVGLYLAALTLTFVW